MAAVAIVATYVYFLLFAQYGFLRLIKEHGGDALLVDRAMGGMGLAGLAASLLTAILLARFPVRRLLRLAFLGCGMAALLALCPHPAITLAASVLVGASTGVLTVALASHLRRWIPGPHFGLTAGGATGLAYFICNIPPLFDGRPLFQSLFAAAVCAAGALAVSALPGTTPDPEPACPGLDRADFRGLGFASLTLALLALVWIDSTAFATIQQTEALKGRTWGGPARQLLMGLVHLWAAVAAGALVDRGWFRGLLLGTFALFVIAFRMLAVWGTATVLPGPLYAIGISTYSVALILVPSARADEPGLLPARWRAALLYGVAGWLGSALGVGMAQHLHHLPAGLLAAAGLVIGAGLLLAHRDRVRHLWLVLLLGLGGLAVYARPVGPEDTPADPVARGREVYRQEACITCHSQYVRPHGPDVLRWGPFRTPDFDDAPGARPDERRPPSQRGMAAAAPDRAADAVTRLPHALLRPPVHRRLHPRRRPGGLSGQPGPRTRIRPHDSHPRLDPTRLRTAHRPRPRAPHFSDLLHPVSRTGRTRRRTGGRLLQPPGHEPAQRPVLVHRPGLEPRPPAYGTLPHRALRGVRHLHGRARDLHRPAGGRGGCLRTTTHGRRWNVVWFAA